MLCTELRGSVFMYRKAEEMAGYYTHLRGNLDVSISN
jgi:hypothetical protein